MTELINGKTPEEIRTGLAYCASMQACTESCPNYHAQGCMGDLIIGSNALIDRLESRVAELEAKQPKWISVGERLPDAHQHVIVHVKHTPKYDAGWHAVEQDCWLGDSWECNSDEEVHLVTHWVQMPEPPEGGCV